MNPANGPAPNRSRPSVGKVVHQRPRTELVSRQAPRPAAKLGAALERLAARSCTVGARGKRVTTRPASGNDHPRGPA
jgi:hypothetical protein